MVRKSQLIVAGLLVGFALVAVPPASAASDALDTESRDLMFGCTIYVKVGPVKVQQMCTGTSRERGDCQVAFHVGPAKGSYLC